MTAPGTQSSSLGEASDGCDPKTPLELAWRLSRYMTDARGIQAHVKRDFGTTIKLEQILKFMAARRAEKTRPKYHKTNHVVRGK